MLSIFCKDDVVHQFAADFSGGEKSADPQTFQQNAWMIPKRSRDFFNREIPYLFYFIQTQICRWDHGDEIGECIIGPPFGKDRVCQCLLIGEMVV
jgi:hypothetical protein